MSVLYRHFYKIRSSILQLRALESRIRISPLALHKSLSFVSYFCIVFNGTFDNNESSFCERLFFFLNIFNLFLSIVFIINS